MRAALPLIAAVLTLAGCGEGEQLSGPCVHRYREPVLTVETRDADRLRLTDVRIDGRRLLRGDLDVETQEGNATHRRGGTLVCDVPCGLGTTPGEWTFVVHAAGHAPTPVRAEATYREGGGGCPSYSSGGTRVEVGLRSPAPG